MNFVDHDGESEPLVFLNFCVHANGAGYSEWLVLVWVTICRYQLYSHYLDI